MRKTYVLAVVFFGAGLCAAGAANMDWLKGQLGSVTSTKLGDTQAGDGLKEALRVGIENTIKLLGRQDGYLNNAEVKILLPKSLQNVDPVLRKMGLGPQIDEFTVSMNRAAEKAAPLASSAFADAIAAMSFGDAQKILNGGNTAATDYMKKAAYERLRGTFKPVIGSAMNQFAVSEKYQELAGKAASVPFVGKFAGNLDINDYVCTKALDGLFLVLSQQEADIRTNPSARVTDLLKKVFTK